MEGATTLVADDSSQPVASMMVTPPTSLARHTFRGLPRFREGLKPAHSASVFSLSSPAEAA